MQKKVTILGIIALILGIALIFKSEKQELVDITNNENNTLAFFVEENGNYKETNTIPTGNYSLNESKSFCSNNARPTWNKEVNALEIMSLENSNTSCYLYFNEICKTEACKTILSNSKLNEGTPDFSKIADTDEGMYKAADEDGISLYYRGSVENNYVKFANKWWRIIRINGDGSIRLIYDGTESHANGTSTSDSIAVSNVKWSHKDAYYNSSSDNKYTADNAYVGFKYTIGEVHGLEIKSNALIELEKWYQNNLASYAAKIDTNAGFCGDRTPSTSSTEINNQGGTGTATTYYAVRYRLAINKTPILTCTNNNDSFTLNSSSKGNKSLTYPIGLITADEVSMAGGVNGIANSGYYLYNGQYYWTMSPCWYDSSAAHARPFLIASNGTITSYWLQIANGLRPVINLRPDVALSGTGTMTDPYVVEGGN